MLSVRNLLFAASISLLSSLPSASANAATIETFSFSQGGWLGGEATLTGAFTGAVDSNGFITKDTLTDFYAQLGSGITSYSTFIFTDYPTSFFSFNTTLPIDSGSLDFYSPLGGVAPICIGAAAAFGLCGPGPGPGLFGGIGLGPYFYTTQAPVVTLVSSVTTGVPEPATWAMMILGFGALGSALRRRKMALTAG